MFAFPSFDKLYESLVQFCEENGNARFKFGRKCVRAIRDSKRGKVIVEGKQKSESDSWKVATHVKEYGYENDETAIRNTVGGSNAQDITIEDEFDYIIFA